MQFCTTYSITRQGHVYFVDGGVKSYLCGTVLTFNGGDSIPNTESYYTDKANLALTIFDWYEAICRAVEACSGNVLMEVLVGARGGIMGTSPWTVSTVDGKYIRCYNPVYKNVVGIYWVAVGSDNTSHHVTDTLVTPSSLSTKPVPTIESPHAWAFKMGTLCSDDISPCWRTLSNHKGYVCISEYLDSAYNAGEILTNYFRLGTLCKWGTPFRLVQARDKGEVCLGTVPFIPNHAMLGKARLCTTIMD